MDDTMKTTTLHQAAIALGEEAKRRAAEPLFTTPLLIEGKHTNGRELRITLVRSLTDTFAGIALVDVPGFIAAQLVGALIGLVIAKMVLGARVRTH